MAFAQEVNAARTTTCVLPFGCTDLRQDFPTGAVGIGPRVRATVPADGGARNDSSQLEGPGRGGARSDTGNPSLVTFGSEPEPTLRWFEDMVGGDVCWFDFGAPRSAQYTIAGARPCVLLSNVPTIVGRTLVVSPLNRARARHNGVPIPRRGRPSLLHRPRRFDRRAPHRCVLLLNYEANHVTDRHRAQCSADPAGAAATPATVETFCRPV